MQTLYEAILKTNIINFLIVLSTLVFVFKKARLGDVIEKMAADVKAKVEKSAQDTQSALAEYKAVKKAVKDTPKLQEEIIEGANADAAAIKEEFESNASKKQTELQEGFERTSVNLIDNYKKKTTSEIYNTCIDLAKSAVLERLNPETHKKLINSSIDELEKIESELL